MTSRPVTVKLPTIDQMLPPAVREALLRKLALLAIGMIKRRTLAGLDVEGRPFKRYVFSYAAAKAQSGMNAQPNLTLSGAMLASMNIVESGPAKVLIGFSGSSPQMAIKRRARNVKSKKTGELITRTFAPTNRQVANAIKAFVNDKGDGITPRRHFFGLSDAERRTLMKIALKDIQQYIGRSALNRALGR